MCPDLESGEGLPVFTLEDEDEELLSILEEAQYLMLRHPVAAQGLFAAFVTEGRRYGRTPEGRRWAERLASSDLVRKGRVVWEVTTMKVLEEDAPNVFPSAYAEAFAEVTRRQPVEPLLARLFDPEDGDAF
jgi:hypothetical protein